jgi:membrane protein implicated in regulation of membrane protease activity
MKKVIEFIRERGLAIMLAGMFTVVSGVMAYFVITNTYLRHSALRQASMVLVFVGLGVYIVGRVSVAARRRREQLEERVKGRRGRSDDEDDEL